MGHAHAGILARVWLPYGYIYMQRVRAEVRERRDRMAG